MWEPKPICISMLCMFFFSFLFFLVLFFLRFLDLACVKWDCYAPVSWSFNFFFFQLMLFVFVPCSFSHFILIVHLPTNRNILNERREAKKKSHKIPFEIGCRLSLPFAIVGCCCCCCCPSAGELEIHSFKWCRVVVRFWWFSLSFMHFYFFCPFSISMCVRILS